MIRTVFIAAAAALTIAAAPAAAATTVSFSGTAVTTGASVGNIMSYSNGSVAVQASGWSYSGTTLENALIGHGTNGLGVTNNLEASMGFTTTPLVDDLTQTDFILLVFNQLVNLQSAVLSPLIFGSSASANNARVAYASLAGAYNGAAPSLIAQNSAVWPALSATAFNVAGSSNYPYVTAIGSGSAVGNVWMISAAKGSTYDGFQLASVTVNSAVPEPSTWLMMFAGFILLGANMRRRRTMLSLLQVA